VKDRSVNWWARLRGLGLAARVVVLCSAVALLGVPMGSAAYFLGGATGALAAATAGGVCLLGTVLALVVSHLLQGPKTVLYGMLSAMALRMGIPLVSVLALHLQDGSLARAGVMYYFLVFYPVTLAVETALSLPISKKPAADSQAPRDSAS